MQLLAISHEAGQKENEKQATWRIDINMEKLHTTFGEPQEIRQIWTAWRPYVLIPGRGHVMHVMRASSTALWHVSLCDGSITQKHARFSIGS